MVKPEIQSVKLRFGIIGNTEELNRAIDVAMQFSGTFLSSPEGSLKSARPFSLAMS